MKYIAEGNLWDEFEAHLEDEGYTELMISAEPIAAMQDLIRQKVATGNEVHKRGQRFMDSIGCGGGHPTLPPKFPGGDGGDGGPPVE